MLIDITVFQLRDGVDEAAFLAADKQAQAELSPARGFIRRTTARGKNGNWLVLTFWGDSEPMATSAALDDLIDPATRRSSQFSDIGG